jgi:hypothetical protein
MNYSAVVLSALAAFLGLTAAAFWFKASLVRLNHPLRASD